ncbi:hypothetical protein DPEC_G00238770 [Dallia pectoralis]|uniref:Uncharacterized protein n=1 Tax=Dallia pectoralis TaxID=75939 RepID=A0ACC2FZA0_DALPE|nr:hypothetical protein DPEC_G00238770 [Dallia pectoralis]
MSTGCISTNRLEELRTHTAQDQVLQNLSTTIQRGWPDKERNVHPSISSFFPYRDELVVEDGIVIKGHKAVIPHSLHREYINIVHRGHPGLESTRRRARGIVFWPSMNRDIAEELMSCSVCNSTRPHQQEEPLQPHPVPALPWSTVATDMFEWHGQQYHVLVDSYSGCDNARQYTSQQFKDLAEQWHFTHVTSSPGYPQSNGLAERAVRSAKLLMEKSHIDGTDVHARLFLSAPDCWSQPPKNTQLVNAQLKNKRLIQKRYYDESSRPLLPLAEGQVVRMQTIKGHDHLGTVKVVCEEPRSHIIESNRGTYRSNRRHILPVAEPPPRQPDPADLDCQYADPAAPVSSIHTPHACYSVSNEGNTR